MTAIGGTVCCSRPINGYIVEERARKNVKTSMFSRKINKERSAKLISLGRKDLIKVCCPEGKVLNDLTWGWVVSKLTL